MSCEYIRLFMLAVLNGESSLMLVGWFEIIWSWIFYKLRSFFIALAGWGRADAGEVFVFISCNAWKSDL